MDFPIFGGIERSSQWASVRLAHLKIEPFCQVCASKIMLSVHHIKPYHLFPKLELDPKNLITLCENKTVNCHLLFGHFKNWLKFNPKVRVDAKVWRKRISG